MPRIEAEQCTPIQVYSLGGSTLFPKDQPGLNINFFNRLRPFLEEQAHQDRAVIAFIGGGQIARDRQEAARAVGVVNQTSIDKFGIFITRHNALFIKDLLAELGLNTRAYKYQQVKPGIIYLRGGTDPGHTTDYGAVDAARQNNIKYVFNISNTPGVHPFRPDGSYDDSIIVPDMTYDNLIPHLAEHTPGHNAPIDKPAAILARDNGIIYVSLGMDMTNLAACLCGEEFVGTILYP
ncbi:hypothetical protein A2154_02135 [Candidatus Gottesmanbacteria bacterium RBG_16_43_7]|uniref:Aspartate/glutamate/uridylate kinase domain-containing protein n=1 Tax=Candidatus Gottesmanbacteria bacterium RBG_16_43_7 TaxID=1798373 RepID=A0A1F5Z906_9BACT|nr:MAG: hypothetical protein A2154_02135 [Candidatus Gottesmanbacteria bacterium RBG_16_43_7]